ncbi:hypothetical protein K2173_001719 [Erythroxylum novogranatense]|uniref:QWRF motif-containing protein 3 n=1 Tax=Erythroxylum novogranatense TaxID=1862640 RepID=A0AAV8S815_9ROSI|nr:hypothetical protein K2173_001719 [Erythroxylum novogranatense]
MKTDSEPLLCVSDQSLKQRRPKSREINSRFLSSPTRSSTGGIPSPNQPSSPVRQKPTRTKHQTSFDDFGVVRGIWPSSSSKNKSGGSLADERLADKPTNGNNTLSLNKQRSYREFTFENEKEKESTKENHRPFFGGSMRYTGKFNFPGKSSFSSAASRIIPRRLSVDESSLFRNRLSSSHPISDPFLDSNDFESECSDFNSSTLEFPSPASSTWSRKSSGREVSSKYLQDTRRHPKDTSDSDNLNSTKIKKFTVKSPIKRTNSIGVHGNGTSQWALSPGRSGATPMSVEIKERPFSFTNLRPPHSSPSRRKGVEKLLSFGLDLLKGKKSSSPSSLLLVTGDAESIHQLRLLQNRLMQWRYANARAEAVNKNINDKSENHLLSAWFSLERLQHSVVQKRLKLEKEKMEMKLNVMLNSQMKLLESWGVMDRHHSSAVSMIKQCLHSVVSRVPLMEGAKVDFETVSNAIRQASDMMGSIKLSFSAGKTVTLLSQLAAVVRQEKLLLGECRDLLEAISLLEIQERSMKSYIIQSNLWQQQLHR